MRDCVHESPDGIEAKVSKKHIHSGQCRCFENTVLKTPFYVFVSFVVQEHIINAVRFGLNGHSPAAETTLVSFPESRGGKNEKKKKKKNPPTACAFKWLQCLFSLAFLAILF